MQQEALFQIRRTGGFSHFRKRLGDLRFGAIEIFKLINKDLLERSDFGHGPTIHLRGLIAIVKKLAQYDIVAVNERAGLPHDGFSTTLMHPSSLSRKVLYAVGASSRGTR